MNKVLSKYKNPDKHIQRLKRELKQTRNQRAFLTEEFNVASSSLEVFRVGDEAVVVGEVIKTEADKTGSKITFGNITISRRPEEK